MIHYFGEHVLDTETCELRRGGTTVAVEPQVFALLAHLIAHHERVVSKDELVAEVWGGRFVTDATLASRVHAARKAVGDDGQRQAVIRTIQRTGFRFVALLDSSAPPSRSTKIGSADDRPSIAVLPFVNLSDDATQDYFCDGITEDIITAVSRIRSMFVIAASTMFTYRGRQADAREVARELGVRYVLEGSIRKDGGRVRVSAMLVDGTSGGQIWADRYDRRLDDIFAVQDEITQQVVGAIEPELDRAERERARTMRQAADLPDWDRYLQAMEALYRGRRIGSGEDIGASIRMFDELISGSPEFSPAYGGLAHGYFFLLLFNLTDDREYARAEGLRVAQRGVQIAIDDHLCQFGLGAMRLARREPELAIAHMQAAVDLNPSFGRAWSYLGTSLVWSGRAAEALPVLETCLRVSPRDPMVGSSFVRCAEAHLALGDLEVALSWATRAVQRADAQFWSNFVELASLGLLGRRNEAVTALERLLARRPDASIELFRTALPIADPALRARYADGLARAGLSEFGEQ
ncbi:MAG: winged helix-turn-helix domain-containing protein [Burkholderiaceae bacterium]